MRKHLIHAMYIKFENNMFWKQSHQIDRRTIHYSKHQPSNKNKNKKNTHQSSSSPKQANIFLVKKLFLFFLKPGVYSMKLNQEQTMDLSISFTEHHGGIPCDLELCWASLRGQGTATSHGTGSALSFIGTVVIWSAPGGDALRVQAYAEGQCRRTKRCHCSVHPRFPK